jgi:hypothetical protein
MKVVVHGLTKEFTTGQGKTCALAGVDLEVRDREFFGIIGPTGLRQDDPPAHYGRPRNTDERVGGIPRLKKNQVGGLHGVSGSGAHAVALRGRKRRWVPSS